MIFIKILVVDDEYLIRNVIKEYCQSEGYKVDEASNGEEAIDKVYENEYDLIIMDIMMPDMDGYEASKEIKEIKDIPIIMLSARTEEEDKLNGFNIGIDDYVTKPFSPKELMARIKAVTKRNSKESIIKLDNIILNNNTREVTIDGKMVELTHTQFELLYLFLSNQNLFDLNLPLQILYHLYCPSSLPFQLHHVCVHIYISLYYIFSLFL